MCFLFVLPACNQNKNGNLVVEIKTAKGDIEVELYAKQAPLSVAAFLKYIDSGYYKNATFYRILNDENQPSNAPKAELIQGGLWKTKGKLAATIKGIPHEPTNQTHILHKDGAISLARLAPGTASTEFFICIGAQPGFDYGGENNADGQGYAAFGKVIKGMNVVKIIYNSPEEDQSFEPPVYIYNIVRK